ncbi:MAG TPA: dihydropteroate synthase [Acidobacteriaceae bacterium]|jgi:dihydropteroate synthase|nr:dihydropteroate synthase [Acidobacteriaceae bacterium]
MTFAQRPPFDWQLRTREQALGARTAVMGVLNVTPDSFSDGGDFLHTEAAVQQGIRLLDERADVLDIGGESTRPGSQPLSPQKEQDRILPVIAAILRERPQSILSVDTYHAATARAAIAAGAEIVNDVSGLAWDAELADACAELRCGVILMHTRGRPAEWRTLPRLAANEVLPVVKDGLEQALARAVAAGIDRRRIVLDPGFGFGKVHEENYPLLAHLEELLSLGQPLLAGLSRKSFLGHAIAARTGVAAVPTEQRGNATVAATTAAILAGASLVRVHEVRPGVEAAAIADAILRQDQRAKGPDDFRDAASPAPASESPL